jgi:diguanylate cyclase (GGDEF)-like protein
VSIKPHPSAEHSLRTTEPRLLIINDNTVIIQLFKEVYEGSPYVILEAVGGEEGIQKAHEHHPDVILLDIEMPGIDGFDVCKRLKADEYTKDIPILFTTAHATDSKSLATALDLGGDDFLAVPFDILELKARVRVLLRLKQYSDRLREQIYKDTLTDLNNRRFFFEKIYNIYYDAILFKDDICFILCDLDHFKKVNDTHGHDAGDQVLVTFARILKENIRASDLVIRYGGEEFLIVLQKCNLDAGIAIAEQIRQITKSEDIQFKQNVIRITVSVGITLFSGREEMIIGVDELIGYADKALYRAKEAGRNRIIALNPYNETEEE